MPISRHEFCCGCLPIFSGIFAIVFHGFVHSIFAMCLILTSYYQQKNGGINYAAVAGYLCLILIGIPIVWVVIFQQIRAVKLCGVLFFFVTLYNLVCAITYFVVYFPFKANSLLDKLFFWRYNTRWVTSEKLPFTMWHVLSGLLVILTPLWFYYTYIILIFPTYLKMVEEEEANSPEIIILENRVGVLGAYRPPVGYPFSTNQSPTVVATNEQVSSMFNPFTRGQDRRGNNTPTSVLD